MSDNTAKDTKSIPPLHSILRIGFQYTKFGIIGVIASAVHICLFVGLIELFEVWDLYANIIAFSVAVIVSYIGNSQWTFKHAVAERDRVSRHNFFVRFWVVALIGLGINSLNVYLVSEVWQVSYYYAVFLMVTLTPVVIFSLNKLWVFRTKTA